VKASSSHNPSLVHLCGRISTVLIALVMAGAAFYGPTKALASDHRDSPTADANAEGDISDIFAFLDPNDSSQLVLIMNVNPFAVPAETPSYRYSPNVLYQFKISNNKVNAMEDLAIQAVFTNVPTTTCASGQMVAVYGPSAPASIGITNSVLKGTPAVSGCTGQTLQEGKMKVFTGLRDDPFVADIGQLNRILSSNQDLFRDFPGFAAGALHGRTVRADKTSGVDGFGGFNVTSIAIELPKSAVASGFLGVQGLIGIWGTTSVEVALNEGRVHPRGVVESPSYVQIQRVGQQLFKTIFVPSAMRDAFNASAPENDTQNWSSLIPATLTTSDNDGTGNTISGRAGLLTALGLTDASGTNAGAAHGAPLLLPATFNNTNPNLLQAALLPDVLRLNLNLLPTGTALPGAAATGGNGDPQLGLGAFGLQNGRRPADAVTDILLQLARQLADVNFPASLGVPGSGPARTGALNFATDRRVLAVLEGTDWIKPDAQVGNVSGNAAPYGGDDQPLLSQFPFLADPHPLPGEAGTVGFPAQQ
jgi:Domain of unknown function (DUF4331)